MKEIPNNLLPELEALEDRIESCIDQTLEISLEDVNLYNSLVRRIDEEIESSKIKAAAMDQVLKTNSPNSFSTDNEM